MTIVTIVSCDYSYHCDYSSQVTTYDSTLVTSYYYSYNLTKATIVTSYKYNVTQASIKYSNY